MATDTWTGGSGDFISGNWTPAQPLTNTDYAVFLDTGTITVGVAAGEFASAGLISVEPSAQSVSFDIKGTLSTEFGRYAGHIEDQSSGDVVVEQAGIILAGPIDLSPATGSIGGDITIAGYVSAFGSIDDGKVGAFDLAGTGRMVTLAGVTIENATNVVFAGSAEIGTALYILGSGSTPTPVTISGSIIMGASRASPFSGTKNSTASFSDVAVALNGGTITLGDGDIGAKGALRIDQQSSFTVTGNPAIQSGDGSYGGGQGVDDLASTTIVAGTTLAMSGRFEFDGNTVTNDGTFVETGGALVVDATASVGGPGVYVMGDGGILDDTADPGGASPPIASMTVVLNTGTLLFNPGTTSATYTPGGVDVLAPSALTFAGASGLGALPDVADYDPLTHSVTFQSGNGTTTDIVQNITLEGVLAPTALAITQTYMSGGNDATITLPCFAAGTRLRTRDGDVAVEALRVGDRVTVLLDSGTDERTIVWVGDRSVDVARHRRPELVAPVTIRAHAVADGVPARDLVVSPDHALLIAGSRIQARQLINGRSITQDFGRPSVHYFHVELATHSVLIAEGLAAESFLDTGNRGAFAGDGDGFFPGSVAVIPFAPLITDETMVRPIWRRIADRANPGEIAATSEPGLHLIVDDRTIRPSRVDGGRHIFALPAASTSVRFASRAAMPCETRPWLDDRRRLGVAVSCVVRHDGDRLTVLPINHAGFSDGWYAVERSGAVAWRWTDGDALIPIGSNARTIVVDVHATAQYPIAARRRHGW